MPNLPTVFFFSHSETFSSSSESSLKRLRDKVTYEDLMDDGDGDGDDDAGPNNNKKKRKKTGQLTLSRMDRYLSGPTASSSATTSSSLSSSLSAPLGYQARLTKLDCACMQITPQPISLA